MRLIDMLFVTCGGSTMSGACPCVSQCLTGDCDEPLTMRAAPTAAPNPEHVARTQPYVTAHLQCALLLISARAALHMRPRY